jgi:hypothetical protein
MPTAKQKSALSERGNFFIPPKKTSGFGSAKV